MTVWDHLTFFIEGKEGGVYIPEEETSLCVCGGDSCSLLLGEKRHDELDVEQPVGRGEGEEEEGVAGMGLGSCDLIDGGRETP